MAAIASALLQRKVFQLSDGGLTSHHVFRDCRLGDLESKHQEFTVDLGRAPQWIFPAHSADQITQASVNPRPPYLIARLPAPEHPKSSAVPPQDRLRQNYPDSTKEGRPEPCHPYEQDAITGAKPRTTSRAPQDDIELMTKKQILRFKPAARLEQVSDKHSERVEDRKHRSQ
jgi:hypothetical protein